MKITVTTFECQRPSLVLNETMLDGRYNLTKYGETAEEQKDNAPRYTCGMNYDKRLRESYEIKNKTKTTIKTIGIHDEKKKREKKHTNAYKNPNKHGGNLTMEVGVELFLPLKEIKVNLPLVSVDVSWGSEAQSQQQPIVQVDTHPMVLTHGWSLMTFNVSLKGTSNIEKLKCSVIVSL